MIVDAFKTAGSSPPERGPDFQLIRQNTFVLLEPQTDRGRAWVEAYISPDATRFGPAIVIEHGYIVGVVAGIERNGLTVDRS